MIPAEARGAWRDIEARLRPYVARRVASAQEVDDIVQEILVRIHKGLATLRHDESFGGWVYRIVQLVRALGPKEALVLSHRRISPSEQRAEARTKITATGCAGRCRLLFAAAAALRGRYVPQHLLHMRSAARERRPPTLPALDPPAHQAAPAFAARGSAA